MKLAGAASACAAASLLASAPPLDGGRLRPRRQGGTSLFALIGRLAEAQPARTGRRASGRFLPVISDPSQPGESAVVNQLIQQLIYRPMTSRDSCPSLQPGCHTGAPLTAAWLPSGPLAGGGARSPRCAFPCSPSPDTAVRAAMRVPEQRSDSQATPGPPKRLGAAESCWSGSKPCIVGLYALNRKKRFYFSEVPTAEKSFEVCRTCGRSG